jgi:glycosyltransferase involved in cell wall biosynthesis
MRVALIIADDRDSFRDFEAPMPYYGAGATARVEGFADLGRPEIHVVSCVRQKVKVPERLAENVFYHPVYVTGGFRKTLFHQYVRRIRRKLTEIQPDIVHGFGTEDYQAFCAAFSGYPNCVTIQGNLRAIARKKRFRPFPHILFCAVLEWIALKKTNAVFCNSGYTDEQVGNLCANRWRVSEPVRKSFLAIKHRPEQPPILMCLGTIVPYKNQVGLIDALDPLAREQTFRLCFAGNQSAHEDYSREFLRRVEERSWCFYAGKLSLQQLEKWLGRSTALIHPTLEESFGIVLIEAMAAGLPVAASNVGGIPDVIQHGVNGFLFDPNNPESIRAYVLRLLDPGTAADLGTAGHQHVRAQNLPIQIAEIHEQYYKQLLAMMKR